ncbi:Protein of unknown function [Bacillus mycoides]|nr:Protein of unknown function [Bacillus mycoides]
MMTTTTITIT